MSLSKTNNQVITVDGPAGAGKSTVSRAVAAKLGWSYVDTGAMYRSITLKAHRNGIASDETDAIIDLAKNSQVKLIYDNAVLTVFLDGEDVSDDIRLPEISTKTSDVAKIPEVREILVEWQRQMSHENNIVVEGRDAGTVVFPNADYKFYLDADVNERTRRRLEDLKRAGKEIDEEELKKAIEARDHNDSTRKASPLKKAEDAIVIDGTHLTIDQTADEIIKIVNN